MSDRNQVVDFIRAKLIEADKSLKAREDMERVWRSGTNESWAAVGCTDSKATRLKHSATHGRIAMKCRREVEMFKAVLDELITPSPA